MTYFVTIIIHEIHTSNFPLS